MLIYLSIVFKLALVIVLTLIIIFIVIESFLNFVQYTYADDKFLSFVRTNEVNELIVFYTSNDEVLSYFGIHRYKFNNDESVANN